MMDLMALFLELVTTFVILVTKPFSLVKLSCIFGARNFCIVIHTWVELLRASVCCHLDILWGLVNWTFAFITLPVRVLTALQRERLLQMRLHELQIELENLVWNRKELEERLQMVIKEHRMMEAMLAELEDEHDEAIVKIELLQSELQDAKQENLRLKEIQHKELWSFRSRDETGKSNDLDNDIAGFKASGPSDAVTPDIISRDLEMNEVLRQRKEVALLQSLFSAVLSLLVGLIIWEAEDPCMPLVVALFTVVGMSLKSVVQFFATINNKPASDAVALLSLNCFILGTLTYPTLPRVASMLTPMALKFLKWTVIWLGVTS